MQRLRLALARWLWPPLARMEQATAQLAMSELRLRAITDNLPALITVFDTEQRYIFVNRRIADALGASVDDLVGRRLRDVTGEELYRAISDKLSIALSGQPVHFELKRMVDGELHYFDTSYVPLTDASGAVISVCGLTIDVTERKRIELLHAQGEQRLRTIADNLPVLIGYLDRDLRFEFCNETFRTWMGRAPGELEGKLLNEIATDAQRLAVLAPYLDRVLRGERVEFDFVPDNGGPQRWLHSTLVPQFDAAGGVAGLFLLASDVTPLKRVEQKLSDMARFDELTGLPNRYQFNEKLQEAIRRAERSRKAMGLIFLDIDHFKQINDSQGHGAGDEVLKEFARRLCRSVRAIDTVARLAGDEFVIVLEDLEDERAMRRIAENILAGMREPFALPGGALVVSASLGLAYTLAADVAAAELLGCADAALYDAKRAGRATFSLRHYQGASVAEPG